MPSYEELSPEKYFSEAYQPEPAEEEAPEPTPRDTNRGVQRTMNFLSIAAVVGIAAGGIYWFANYESTPSYQPQTIEGHLASTPGFGILFWLKGEGIDAAEKVDRKYVRKREADARHMREARERMQEQIDRSMREASRWGRR